MKLQFLMCWSNLMWSFEFCSQNTSSKQGFNIFLKTLFKTPQCAKQNFGTHHLRMTPFIIKKMCFAMGFNTNQSQSQVEWNSFVEFRLIWAHECLKMFFYIIFFTSFLLSCNTPKMAMKMCSFSDPNHNSVPARRIHSRWVRTHTHHTRRNYSEEEQLSGPIKKTLMGAVGICSRALMRQPNNVWKRELTLDWVSMTRCQHPRIDNSNRNDSPALNNELLYQSETKKIIMSKLLCI